MALSADTLLDRLHLKRQITRWRLLAVLAVIFALLVLVEAGSSHSPIGRAYIGRLTLDGVIFDDLKRDQLIAEIRDNPHIAAVVVRLDTPGGSAVAGMQVFRQLRDLAQAKPVVAVMRDLSASAGYLIAVGADRIYANEGTLTGSIGVIIQTAEVTELAKKLGITPITVKTGPHKDILSPYSKVEPDDLQIMQQVVDDFYQTFVDTIAERRKLPREEVLKMADGRVFTGKQAMQLKLVDALGDEREALAWLEKERNISAGLPVKELKVKQEDLPFLTHLTETLMQKIMPARAAALDGLVAIWHPDLQIQ